MATELTPEQKKALNKLALKHFGGSVLLGMSSAVTLVLINIVMFLIEKVLELPEGVGLIVSVVAAFVVFRKMFLDSKESHDRFILEVKKITDQK